MSLDNYKAAAQAAIDAKRYREEHKREYAPEFYPWQKKAMLAPEGVKQVLLMSGNRSGKTMSAGFHMACDLTQDYPEWWDGFRYEHNVRAMALGVDNTQLKDVVQLELFGEVDESEGGKKFTGGWVHPDEILAVEWSKQTTNLARRVTVKGKYGPSYLSLRAYTQSKTGQATLSFAGTSLDRVWVDECPPDEMVGQLTTRTMTGCKNKGGRVVYTLTPELGVTNLIKNFMEKPVASQLLVGPIPWDDCPHLTPEVQETILAALPEHEHDMRSKGIPFFGSGLVFPVAEERIKIEPFDLESRPWIRGLKAMDIGITHPTAIAWLAYDPEDDTIYVVKTYRKSGEAAAVHAAVANAKWPRVPTVFPHDVDKTEPGSGKTVRVAYANAGLANTLDFRNPDGSLYVEPGIMDMLERMRTNRFKVFSDCEDYWNEHRMYHRKDGKIVDENDDIMSAVRYGSVMIPNFGVHLRGHRAIVPKVVGVSAR